MHELDGTDAGGQFVRSALSLSVLWNEPVRITNIRGDRPTPGLGHQHLAVLEMMAEISGADVTGAAVGAETIEFDPTVGSGRLAGGSYAVDIGTAGSISLLFDALLPLATILEAPLSVTVTGGTDVKWSPPIDYLRHVKLPLLRQYGLAAACEVDRRGFYPDGGGRATLHLAPSAIEPIDCVDRGPIEGLRVYSTESASLADREVAHRQFEGARRRLQGFESDKLDGREPNEHGSIDERDGDSLPIVERQETTAASHCPGTAIVVRIDHGTGVAGFGALGERGTPAERVGETAADAATRWLDGRAPVDRHMADQLLVFLAIAGGRVRVPTVTDHVAASCDLLRSFGLEPAIGAGETVGTDSETQSTIVSIETPHSG